MKRLPLFLLAGLIGPAHSAGFEAFLNPMTMMTAPMSGYGNPFGSPYGNPFGGNPFGGNPFSNPLGGLTGLGGLGLLAAPLGLGLINPFGMGNVTYPAMQMAPNMMSYSHYNQMGNPYANGFFGGGNPYMQRNLPNPFAPPAFSPSMPTMPFSPSQGTLPILPFMPQQQAAPMPGFGGGSPFAGLLPMPVEPVRAPQQSSAPFSFFLTQPTPQPVYAPAPPPPAATVTSFPFPFLATPAAPAVQTAPPPAPTKPAAAPSATPPLDPAAFLQFFMKPTEPPKVEAGKVEDAKVAPPKVEAPKAEPPAATPPATASTPVTK